jgi:hypothetical protein
VAEVDLPSPPWRTEAVRLYANWLALLDSERRPADRAAAAERSAGRHATPITRAPGTAKHGPH